MDDDFIKKRLARDMAELKKLCEEHFKQRFVPKIFPKIYEFFYEIFTYFFWKRVKNGNFAWKNNVPGVENRPIYF